MPNCIWLTTEEVITHYGFDPLPHVDIHTSPGGDFIRNMLTVRNDPSGVAQLTRVWIKDDLQVPADKATRRRAAELEAATIREFTKTYTKGMAKKS